MRAVGARKQAETATPEERARDRAINESLGREIDGSISAMSGAVAALQEGLTPIPEGDEESKEKYPPFDGMQIYQIQQLRRAYRGAGHFNEDHPNAHIFALSRACRGAILQFIVPSLCRG